MKKITLTPKALNIFLKLTDIDIQTEKIISYAKKK